MRRFIVKRGGEGMTSHGYDSAGYITLRRGDRRLILSSLMTAVGFGRARRIRTIPAIIRLLVECAGAIRKDIDDCDISIDIVYDILYAALSDVFPTTEWILWGRCYVEKNLRRPNNEYLSARRKAIGIRLELPESQHKVAVVVHDKTKSLFISPVDRSDPPHTVLAVDIQRQSVKEMRGAVDDPTKPATTRNGTPCVQCEESLKKDGRRCGRIGHEVSHTNA